MRKFVTIISANRAMPRGVSARIPGLGTET
jgi:hypothetical protein